MVLLTFILILATSVDGDGVCSVPSSKCSVSTASACDDSSGCQWNSAQSATCGYPSASQCAGSEPSCPAGCIYYEGGGMCIGPGNDLCETLSGQDNCWSHGCEWYEAVNGCSRLKDCASRSQETCTAANFCYYEFSTFGRCTDDRNTDFCVSLETADACNANVACSWYPPMAYCSFPSPHCNHITGQSTCTQTDGCKWAPDSSFCRVKFNCSTIPPSRCANEPGCVMGEQRCTYKNNPICYEISESLSCREAGCEWLAQPAGCTRDQKNCYPNESGTGCSTQSVSDGCTWVSDSTVGSCRRNCSENSQGTDCTESSLDAGCYWYTHTSGQCSSNYSLACYDNVGKTGCDAESDAACTWKSTPAHCGYDVSLNCYDNTAHTACDDASTSRGCVWLVFPAECSVNYYSPGCFNDAANIACDAASDAGCVWHPAVDASCEIDDQVGCFANADNTDCTEISKTRGCEGPPGNDSASVAKALPFLILLTLVALL